VIKYVAVLGYCYSSHDVVRMRIHDIRVVADLGRRDPTTPDSDALVVYDGTISRETVESKSMVEEAFASVQSIVQAYWTGPWPVLHLVVSFSPISGVTLSLHLGIDIIGSLAVYPDTIVDLIWPTLVRYAAGASNPDTVLEASFADVLEYVLGVGGAPFLAATMLAGAMKVAALFIEGGLLGATVFVGLVTAYVTSIVIAAANVVMGVLDGRLHPWPAAFVLLFWGFVLLGVPSLTNLYGAAMTNDELNSLKKIEGAVSEIDEINRNRAIVTKFYAGIVLFASAIGLLATSLGLLVWAVAHGVDTTYPIEAEIDD